jgi:hypothetical protein
MAIECLEFPSTEVAVSEEEKMAAPKPTNDWKGWLALVLTALGLVGGASWGIEHEFSELEKHLARVETAVRVIGAKQGGDTQTIVDEALKVAMNDSKAGRIGGASSVLSIANRLLEEQKEAHVIQPQQNFNIALEHYQLLRDVAPLKEAAHHGLITLAEYRTETVDSPPGGAYLHIGYMKRIGSITYLSDSSVVGPDGLNTGGGETDIDNFILKNVTFTNVTIVYRGGHLSMQNVRFINCKFLVPESPHGDQLLDAAIKQETDAQIG